MLVPMLVAQSGGGGAGLITGTGQGASPSGNQVTKTLSASGGDFTTFAQVMDYLANNQFNNVEMLINVSAGTYDIDPDSWYVLSHNNGISWIKFQGANKSTCIFNCKAVPEQTFFVYGAKVYFVGLTFQSEAADGAYLLEAYQSYVYLADCNFVDFYGLSARHSFLRAYQCSFTSPNYEGSGFLEFLEGSNGEIEGCTIDDESQNAWGVSAYNGSRVRLMGTNTIRDCDEAIHVEGGGQVFVDGTLTLTNNSTDYNITANQIQYDGGLISTGAAALSFAS